MNFLLLLIIVLPWEPIALAAIAFFVRKVDFDVVWDSVNGRRKPLKDSSLVVGVRGANRLWFDDQVTLDALRKPSKDSSLVIGIRGADRPWFDARVILNTLRESSKDSSLVTGIRDADSQRFEDRAILNALHKWREAREIPVS